MVRLRAFILSLVCVLVIGAGVTGVPRAHAQNARAGGPTPPRLAFVDGEVSFWRPGAEDWAPAQVNIALAAGDSLYVGDGGNLEVEIGARAYVRAGSDTQLGIESLETGYLQLEVTGGHAAIDLRQLPDGQEIEVDTPNGAFTIDRPGYYRVDVDDGTTFTARRGGVATVVPVVGGAREIGSEQRVVLEGTETATIAVDRASDSDDWDRWNLGRGVRLDERPRSAEYVPPAIAGVDDLEGYGEWRDTPRYGHVWLPRDVPPDWAPYSTGRWVWDPYYEWTWVDDAPWGWAPYHYGRWCRLDGHWGWAPGPVVAAPVYAPALVAFFGSGGVSVGIGAGAPFVSWVALGFGEPVLPWWGPVGFHGRPYWGGWSGPRVVNNVVIKNTTIVNVKNINRFTNVDVRNAVVGVDREHFGRGGGAHVRVRREQAGGLQLVRGQIDVRPVPESLIPRAERARRPPERIQNRRVVATRPPQDPSARLRAAGIDTHGSARPVEPRVVQPTGARGRRPGDRTVTLTPPPRREREGGTADEQPRPRDEHDRANLERGHRVVPPTPGHERGHDSGPARADARRGHGAVPAPAEQGRGNTDAASVGDGREAPPRTKHAGPRADDERGGAGLDRRQRDAAPPTPSGEDGHDDESGRGNVRRGHHDGGPVPAADHGGGGGMNVERARRSIPAPAPDRGRGDDDRGATIERRHAGGAPHGRQETQRPTSERGGSERAEGKGKRGQRPQPDVPPGVPRD